MARSPAGLLGESAFLRRVFLVIGAVALVLLVVRLSNVLLLAFGSVLVAVLLRAVADPLGERLKLGRDVGLGAAVVLVSGAVAAGVWLFGQEIEAQIERLSELLPLAWIELQAWLRRLELGDLVLRDIDRLGHSDGLFLRWAPRLAADAMEALAMAVIVIFAGLYLAFRPDAYIRGLLMLAPPAARPRASEVLRACGFALRQWLLGQLISMALVGATTAAGLWLAGVPSPAALGLLAGLGQFVPVIGPVVTAIPGLLLAMVEGPETLLWAGAVYLAVVQLESNLFTPFVLRQMAELPMALTLFAVLALGGLLGALGVLFATPLALVVYVMVRMLYVEDMLGEPPVVRGDGDAGESG